MRFSARVFSLRSFSGPLSLRSFAVASSVPFFAGAFLYFCSSSQVFNAHLHGWCYSRGKKHLLCSVYDEKSSHYVLR